MENNHQISQKPLSKLNASLKPYREVNRNNLLGRPLSFGDREQIQAIHQTGSIFPLLDFDDQPESRGPEHQVVCIRCHRLIRIRKRWTREKFCIVTPRIHTCRCDQRLLVFRAVVTDWDEPVEYQLTDGDGHYIVSEPIGRWLGAYESIDDLDFRNPDADPWRFYNHHYLIKPYSK
jgi:hypothetical protein